MGWSHSPLALCPMQVTQGAELQERAREVEDLQVRKIVHYQELGGRKGGEGHEGGEMWGEEAGRRREAWVWVSMRERS